MPLFSKHVKTPRETLTLTKNDGSFALGNVPSDTHIEAVKSNGSGHLLTSRTTPMAPKHGQTLEVIKLDPNPSLVERVTITRAGGARKQPPPPRATPRAIIATTTAYNGLKSYATIVGNVQVHPTMSTAPPDTSSVALYTSNTQGYVQDYGNLPLSTFLQFLALNIPKDRQSPCRYILP
ncbi:Hypothetical predicted protein [Olea europaea subsp. europaea]|uniref:Uncharacterized protein n=1 Tax=Olea europaea subsp. europaea TaxID=158383 RepID=A0A8S0SQF7_OLEEU|nr:Hypothetical predicted protein [Olea europaea subsp. europaea]